MWLEVSHSPPQMGDDATYYNILIQTTQGSINDLVKSNPELTPQLKVLWETAEQFRTFFDRLVLEERAKSEAIAQEKQEVDSQLLDAVQSLSIAEFKLSKTAITDVKAYIRNITSVSLDEVNEKKANDIMILYQHHTTTRLDALLQTHEKNIATAEFNIKSSSSKLPKLVLEKWVILKLQKQRAKKELLAEKGKAAKADRARRMLELKQESVRLFSFSTHIHFLFFLESGPAQRGSSSIIWH